MTQRSRALSLTVALLVGLAPGYARADLTKAQCIDANTKGQDLRRDGKLIGAREQLRLCAAPSCPGILRDDCIRRLDEVEKAQPTIAFEVKDATGADVSAVAVTMDGKPITEGLRGEALPVDIGEHVFSFAVAGQPPILRTLVLTEGEKGRRERIEVGTPAPAATPPAETLAASQPNAAPPAPEASPPATDSVGDHGGNQTQKILGLVAGGLGLGGLGLGAAFGLMALSEKNQQESDCSTTACSDHEKAVGDHSSAETDGLISTVGFVAGGALLVAGTALFFTAGHSPDSSATTGLLITPSVGPGGTGISLAGKF